MHDCLLSVTFGISIALTALSLVTERKEGLIDRTWVAGVNVTEMILSQILTQFFVLLVQIILLVVVVIFAFKVTQILLCAAPPLLFIITFWTEKAVVFVTQCTCTCIVFQLIGVYWKRVDDGG